MFVESKIWDQGRHPDFSVVLHFACEKSSPYAGRKLTFRTDGISAGYDWGRAGEILRPFATCAPKSARDRQAAEGTPQDLVFLFFDNVDANGRHLAYPDPSFRGREGLFLDSDPQIALDRDGTFSSFYVNCDEIGHASKITLRAFVVLDRRICARSNEVMFEVRSTDLGRAWQLASGDAGMPTPAGNAGCFGPPLVEGRLAIEEIVSDAALREELLKKIDAFDAEASGTLRAAAADPTFDMGAEKLWADGGRLQQALAAGIPVAQQESVAKRVSTLENQLMILRCLGGGDGKALVGALATQLRLTDIQRAKAVALIAPLEEAQRIAITKPATAPVTTPLESARPLMETYRKFRALLTPAQQAAYDRTD